MKGFATAVAVAGVTLISTSAFAQRSSYEAMAASHAAANGVPVSLFTASSCAKAATMRAR